MLQQQYVVLLQNGQNLEIGLPVDKSGEKRPIHSYSGSRRQKKIFAEMAFRSSRTFSRAMYRKETMTMTMKN